MSSSTIRKSGKSGSPRILGIVFLTVGLVIGIAGGGICYWSTQDLLNNGQRSTGTIVEMRKPPMSRYAMPVVQFETADHQAVTGMSKTGSNPPRHKVGDSVTVIYRANAPEEITIDDFLELWLLTGILGGIGLVFITIGAGMLIYSGVASRTGATARGGASDRGGQP